jgi:hypothetical protein
VPQSRRSHYLKASYLKGPNDEVSGRSQPQLTLDLSLSESAGSGSLHRRVRHRRRSDTTLRVTLILRHRRKRSGLSRPVPRRAAVRHLRA